MFIDIINKERRDKMYDIRLKTLLKLTELKNYTKTAQILNFTQPTVTQHIKSLEKEYNIKIFVDKDLNLTKAGHMLLEYAKQTDINYSLFNNKMENLALSEDIINIGLTRSVYPILLESKILEDLIKHTKNRLAILVLSKEELALSLEEGKLDFVFANNIVNSNNKYYEIYEDEIILAVNKEHNLIKKDKDNKFKKYYLVTLDNNDINYNKLNIFYENEQVNYKSFKGIIETNLRDIAKRMVIKNNAIGAFYKSNIKEELKEHQLVEYKKTNIKNKIYLLINNINYLDNNKKEILNLILDKLIGKKDENNL